MLGARDWMTFLIFFWTVIQFFRAAVGLAPLAWGWGQILSLRLCALGPSFQIAECGLWGPQIGPEEEYYFDWKPV